MESFGELGLSLAPVYIISVKTVKKYSSLSEWKDDLNICLQHINDPGGRTALELG